MTDTPYRTTRKRLKQSHIHTRQTATHAHSYHHTHAHTQHHRKEPPTGTGQEDNRPMVLTTRTGHNRNRWTTEPIDQPIDRNN